MCRHEHELCKHDLRGMSKHEVNQHYFEFVRNPTKEERVKYGLGKQSIGVYKCKICGDISFHQKDSFKKCLKACKNKCNGERKGNSGNIVVIGYNDLATTHPYLAKEWHPTKNGDLTPQDITYGNRTSVWWQCEHGHEWKMVIKNRTTTCKKRKCSNCPYCSDGMSYSEKLMTIILDKLNIKYTRQLTYDDGKHKYKYDFYLPEFNSIEETNGIQHYEEVGWSTIGGRTLEEEQINDENKRYDAIHYLKVKYYDQIDCRYSTLEWCRPNIEKALSKYVDVTVLTDKDWQEADVEAQKSIRIEVCKYWKEQKEINKDLTPLDVAKEFKIDRRTVNSYLNWGDKYGLCTYNGEEEAKNNIERLVKKQSKFVYLIKPNGIKWFEEAMNLKDLAKESGISDSTIGRLVTNNEFLKYNSTAKYDPKYIGSYVVDADEWDSQHS